MSGTCKSRKFLHELDVSELKAIKVRIKNLNASGTDTSQTNFRELDDPKKLVIHFKREESRGIFDRQDIIVNQEFKNDGRTTNRWSSTSSYDESCSSEDRYIKKKSNEGNIRKGKTKVHYRSRTRSKERYRAVSSERYRARSHSSPRREQSTERRRKSRSMSPPIKKPGIYIPPKSDYLRYEKRGTHKKSRSPSHIASCSGLHSRERKHSSRSPMHYKYSSHKSRSPHSGLRTSSSIESRESPERFRKRTPTRSYDKHREERSSIERKDRYSKGKGTSSHTKSIHKDRFRRSRSAQRRSRSPVSKSSHSKSRRSRSRSSSRRNKEHSSRRSRSHSRHRDREFEYANSNKPPYIFQDGEYWIAAGALPKPGYLPRGYLPPPIMYPRGFGPPIMMPRLPMPMMQPYRPRIYRPRQANLSNATATSSELGRTSNLENEQTHLETEEIITHEKPSGVVITEVVADNENISKTSA